MTRDQLLKHWTVIEAFRNGKQIQVSSNTLPENWTDTENPNFHHLKYRIKPEKKEIWVNMYPQDGRITRALGYSTREEADRFGKQNPDRIACVKIVYEEGDGL